MTTPALDTVPYVLVVEDEPRLSKLLADYLRAADMEAAVLDNGSAVVPAVRQRGPDLIVLDLMLPGTDGLTVCRELRSFSDVPVLMLTARVEEVDRLIGLEAGADDYVCKPFSPREVVARVKAILRRQRRDAAPAPVEALVLDDASHQARFQGQLLDLTPVEFRLLASPRTAPAARAPPAPRAARRR